MLAEKIYKIQKELQEKKRDREKVMGVGRAAGVGSVGPAGSGLPNSLAGMHSFWLAQK